MDNKYWRSENELGEGIDGIKGPTPYEVSNQPKLTGALTNKVEEDFTKYFYCPVCGKKSLINDAVTRRFILNRSFGLDNALMPGWMKIKASTEACYIRVCPQCETKRLPDDAFFRAYDGNAIETRKGKIRAAENSGCIVLLTVTTALSSLACWGLILILGI